MIVVRRFSSITWLTIFSLAIGLFFFWLFLIINFSSKSLIGVDGVQFPILVEFSNDSSSTSIDVITEKLKQSVLVSEESVQFFSEEDAMERMIQELSQLDSSLSDNPFSKIITFKWEELDGDMDKKTTFLNEIENTSGVSGVYEEETSFEDFFQNVKMLRMISIFSLIVLGAFSLVLLYNVIRLFLINDEKKVKTMLLVGAEESFIIQPYIRSALVIGLFSFIISALILFLVYLSFVYGLSGFSEVLSLNQLILAAFIVLLVSLILPSISTYIIIRLYLRKL